MSHFDEAVKEQEERLKKTHAVVMGIVDDDISDCFEGYDPGSYVMSIPLDMQIARKLTEIAEILKKEK